MIRSAVVLALAFALLLIGGGGSVGAQGGLDCDDFASHTESG